ncbi:MAG: XrtA system polysaccharide deacetylase [Gammaproteobacteria bacterium]
MSENAATASAMPAGGMLNALSVDVEDYYHVSAFAPYIDRDQWPRCESRVEANMRRILELFASKGAKSTFFFLGCVAERYPELVRETVEQGHEVASHGYSHVRVHEQSRQEFRDDVVRTKQLLEDISGQSVVGYRAASFSIDERIPWAYEVLAETGHRYSSSIFPVRHDRYGSMRDAHRFAARRESADIVELPVTTFEFAGMRLPCGGGGYFRLLPYAWSRWGIGRVHRDDQQPAMFYFHPWEIDSGQPRVEGIDGLSRFRHYVNLDKFEAKLARLLGDFRWTTIAQAYQEAI